MLKRPLSPSAASPSAKKKKYKSHFQAEWLQEFSYIKRSEKGDGFALCSVCNSSFSITAGGKNDITRHSKGSMHVANANSSKTTPKIASLFKATAPDRVTHAEVLFSAFVAEHNLPFAVADHFTDLCQHMFPDSEIAKKFACRRTKTTHIINRAIAPSFDSKVTEACKTEKFSIMVDESNDQGGEKTMAILIRVADRSLKRIATRFLAMPICNIGTGQNLFNAINNVFM